ncbi:3-keto-disaccharide hydrolase [Ulvibacterium marinum]|uniref:3-keto-disaccharide hydrolase n=1 Tax=Ulvibacterium marinum TaxID=2419782 RepID=UPI002494661B|nr:family 16 glycoside hydrolase [Ulvibacterium marinum]
MKRFFILFLIIALNSCKSEKKNIETDEQWISLWNGKDLSGWHSYLGTPYQLKTDSLGNTLTPFGIDNDPLEVITLVDTDDGKAIRITGVAWGMIYTEQDYQNYHLKLKTKWGEGMHPPREKGPRDSGLLYHGFGVPGSVYNWMGSQELQVQQGDMGDYWPVGDVEIDIPSVPKDSVYYIYKDKAPLRSYYFADILKTATHDSLAKRRVFKAFDAERPHGEWNDVELIALGDSSIHIVNGKVVMRLFNSRKMSTQEKLHSGKIILQSEGAEVFYKDLYIKQITEVPEKYR